MLSYNSSVPAKKPGHLVLGKPYSIGLNIYFNLRLLILCLVYLYPVHI